MYELIYNISIANRVDPDQVALTKAALSGSALFPKALKGVYEVKG